MCCVCVCVYVCVCVCVCVCVVGDSPELHDHDGGAAGPATGYCGGERETRAGGGEESTHSAICPEQEVCIHVCILASYIPAAVTVYRYYLHTYM